MKIIHTLAGALILAFTAGTASAQVHLNEIYFNDASTDDMEFIELKGTANLALSDALGVYMVLVVEGDGTTVHGILDKAFDLTGKSIAGNGYFVLGDATVVPAPDFVFTTATNSIENGADTFYLIKLDLMMTSVATITALLGTHIDSPLGGNVTVLPTLTGVTIVDSVAVTDGATTAITYDGATLLGPTPAPPNAPNIYRCNDYPGAWDTASFLAVDPSLNPHPWPTPSALNENLCPGPVLPGTPFCAGDGIDPNVTTPCPCGNVGIAGHGCANSVNSNGSLLDAAGSTAVDPVTLTDTVILHGSQMPLTVNAIYLKGDGTDDAVFGDGVRCVGGFLVRLKTKVNVNGASQYPDPGDLSLSVRGGNTIGSGQVANYQVYYRNSAAGFCPPATFNVSNGWTITW